MTGPRGFAPAGFTLERYQTDLKNLESEIKLATDQLNNDPSERNEAALKTIEKKMQQIRKDIDRAVQTDREMKKIWDDRQKRAVEAKEEHKNNDRASTPTPKFPR